MVTFLDGLLSHTKTSIESQEASIAVGSPLSSSAMVVMVVVKALLTKDKNGEENDGARSDDNNVYPFFVFVFWPSSALEIACLDTSNHYIQEIYILGGRV